MSDPLRETLAQFERFMQRAEHGVRQPYFDELSKVVREIDARGEGGEDQPSIVNQISHFETVQYVAINRAQRAAQKLGITNPETILQMAGAWMDGFMTAGFLMSEEDKD